MVYDGNSTVYWLYFYRYFRRDYERVLRYEPTNLPARVNLAYTLQVSGHFMQAWRQFTTALDFKPSKLVSNHLYL